MKDDDNGAATRTAGSDAVTRASKFMAYVLRHRPDEIGLILGPGGWVPVEELLAKAAEHGRPLDAAMLERVLTMLGKRRYEIRDGLIRAAQGHSLAVDLGLPPTTPPPVLYHGTVARFLDGIRAGGLRPGARTHVHLSPDRATAVTVGARRGQPVVLLVDAASMSADGHEFFQAANGVWLTAQVPPAYLTLERCPTRSLRGTLVMEADWDSDEVNDAIASDFGPAS